MNDTLPVSCRPKRSEALHLRLTREEHAGLRVLSTRTGIRRSRLVRKALRELITGGADLLERDQQAVLELARQMRLIGVNLNQIARRVNQGEPPGRALADVLDQLRAALKDCEWTWRRQVAATRARIVAVAGRD
ncbi:MAG: hypothetical protein JWR07_4117 [Nevskia sp.]|nr:hypothetical protein [Nevskia sp.]